LTYGITKRIVFTESTHDAKRIFNAPGRTIAAGIFKGTFLKIFKFADPPWNRPKTLAMGQIALRQFEKTIAFGTTSFFPTQYALPLTTICGRIIQVFSVF
jgi:hypothetical protein